MRRVHFALQILLEPRSAPSQLIASVFFENKHSITSLESSTLSFLTWQRFALVPLSKRVGRISSRGPSFSPQTTIMLDRRETLKVSSAGHLTEILLTKGDAIGQAVSEALLSFFPLPSSSSSLQHILTSPSSPFGQVSSGVGMLSFMTVASLLCYLLVRKCFLPSSPASFTSLGRRSFHFPFSSRPRSLPKPQPGTDSFRLPFCFFVGFFLLVHSSKSSQREGRRARRAQDRSDDFSRVTVSLSERTSIDRLQH